jgi:uracil phosphoribosyltransferase
MLLLLIDPMISLQYTATTATTTLADRQKMTEITCKI